MRWRASYSMILMMAACALVAYGVYALLPHQTAPTSVHIPATPAKEVRGTEKEAVTPKVAYVYSDSAKSKLKLPDAVQADATVKVVSASRVEADERAHTVTTTLNIQTGEFTTYDRSEPIPWLSIKTRGEAGIAYGVKNGTMVGRLYVNQDIVQIKSVRIGAMATLDQDGDYFVGIRAGLRW